MALVLPEGKGDPIREEFLLDPVDRILVQARIFSLKLLIMYLYFVLFHQKLKEIDLKEG